MVNLHNASSFFYVLVKNNFSRWISDAKFQIMLVLFFIVPFIQTIVLLINLPEIKDSMQTSFQASELTTTIEKAILTYFLNPLQVLILFSFCTLIFAFLATNIVQDFPLYNIAISTGVKRTIIIASRVFSIFVLGNVILIIFVSYQFFNILLSYIFLVNFLQFGSVFVQIWIYYTVLVVVVSLGYSLLLVPFCTIIAVLLRNSLEALTIIFTWALFGAFIIPPMSQQYNFEILLIINPSTYFVYPLNVVLTSKLQEFSLGSNLLGVSSFILITPVFFGILIVILLALFWSLTFIQSIHIDL